MEIYNRETKQIEIEKEYQKNLLNFLYKTFVGRILLKFIFARPWFSKLRAIYMKSSISKKDIVPFIKKNNLTTIEYGSNFKNFNDFFIRKRNIKNNSKTNELVAIADSKLSVYKITNDLKLNIKNSCYTIDEILGTKGYSDYYKDGYCLIFRLSVDDYHRYNFIDDGTYINQYFLQGELHTIRPISSKYKVFSRNSRVINILNTKNMGKIIQIEVGAMLVGHIKNKENILSFNKLEEKGYFEYGGSTIIVLLNKNIKFEKDILEYNKKDIEVKLKIGDKIGEIIC